MTRSLKIALVALVVSLPLLMAPTGGFPSRPRFQSVGVGVVAPPGVGNIATSGNITAANVSASSGFNAFLYNLTNGGVTGFVQADGAGIGVGGSSAHPLSLYAGGTIGARMQPSGAFDALNGFTTNGTAATFPQGATVTGDVNLNSDTATVRVRTAAGAARGRLQISGGDVFLANDNPGGWLMLVTTGGGLLTFNTEPVATVISARKGAPTTRTSTTTSAADPDLTFTLPAGSWELTGFMLFDAITTTTQGARYQMNFAGTFDPALVIRCVDTRTSLLAAATVGIQAMNSDTLIADVSTSNLDIAEIRCYMRATVGGTLQIRWAQEASSANGTRLNNGSWLNAKRVGA